MATHVLQFSSVVGGRTQSVPAVEKVFSILEVLAASKSGLTLCEIARVCGLPKSSVHCILMTCQRQGYLHRSPRSSRYLFARKLFHLAGAALGGSELREQADPCLHWLILRTGLTTHLGIVESGEAVVVARMEHPGARVAATWVGKRMELHCTGLGKALMSEWGPDQLQRLAAERGLARHNDNTISTVKRLAEELVRVRQLGYAIDDEEDVLGARCIAAPVRGPAGEVIAALSVAGTTAEITAENAPEIAAHVKSAARALARTLALHNRTRD